MFKGGFVCFGRDLFGRRSGASMTSMKSIVCVNRVFPTVTCVVYTSRKGGYATMVFILSFLMACAPDAVSADLRTGNH